MRAISVMFFLALGIGVAHADTEAGKWRTDWQAAKEVNGFSAECREHNSGINQCRITAVTAHSVDSLLAVNIDGAHLKDWMVNVLTSEVLPPASQLNYYMYMTYHFNGAGNRDSVTHSVVTKDPQTQAVTLAFQSEENSAKPKDLRFVRFPAIKGKWEFIPLDNGKTKVIYTNIALPGEYVQEFMATFYNMGSLDASIESMEKLFVQAERPEYANAKINFGPENLATLSATK